MLDEITRPFRQYHFVTSEHDIIQNNIRADNRGNYNAVEVVYVDDSDDSEEPENWMPGALERWREDGNSVVIKIDDSLPSHLIKTKLVYEPNCNGEDMARRYALAHLWREVKDHYKGSITIIGNPKIKPYDIVYIYDSVNDIVGPIEVKRVIHTFSPETGFITEIYPSVCCAVNEMVSMSVEDACLHALDYLWGRMETKYKAISVAGGAAAAVGSVYLIGPLLTLGLVGLGGWAGVKLVKFAMGRHPIIITPLLKGGSPYLIGLGGREYKNVIRWCGDKWVSWYKDFERGKRIGINMFREFMEAILEK